MFARRGSRARPARVKIGRSVEQRALDLHHYVQEMEELLGEPLRPGRSLRRVAAFRELGVRWAAASRTDR